MPPPSHHPQSTGRRTETDDEGLPETQKLSICSSGSGGTERLRSLRTFSTYPVTFYSNYNKQHLHREQVLHLRHPHLAQASGYLLWGVFIFKANSDEKAHGVSKTRCFLHNLFLKLNRISTLPEKVSSCDIIRNCTGSQAAHEPVKPASTRLKNDRQQKSFVKKGRKNHLKLFLHCMIPRLSLRMSPECTHSSPSPLGEKTL